MPELDMYALLFSFLLFTPSIIPHYSTLHSLYHFFSPLYSSIPLTRSRLYGNIQEQRNGCRSTRCQSEEDTE